MKRTVRAKDNRPESASPPPSDGWVPLCRLDQIPGMMPLRATIDGRGVLVCRDGEAAHVVDEICPHKHEVMQFALVLNGEIICPHHQYPFDLATGNCRRRGCPPLRTWPCRVRDGVVEAQPASALRAGAGG